MAAGTYDIGYLCSLMKSEIGFCHIKHLYIGSIVNEIIWDEVRYANLLRQKFRLIDGFAANVSCINIYYQVDKMLIPSFPCCL